MAVPPENIEEEIRGRLNERRYDEAFDLVLARYRNKIMRLAFSIVGNLAGAEDAAQDACVRIWRALPSYRGDSSVSTWVYAITRNTCLTAVKRASTRESISSDDPVFRHAASSISAPASKESAMPNLLRVLQQLPEKHRQAVRLFYMEEKSYGEVATMMDLPIGTVKTYLHRARKALAGALLVKNMRTRS
jgi:RNA polymerase sigma-70 factor (ECF subfamily)